LKPTHTTGKTQTKARLTGITVSFGVGVKGNGNKELYAPGREMLKVNTGTGRKSTLEKSGSTS